MSGEKREEKGREVEKGENRREKSERGEKCRGDRWERTDRMGDRES